ncbi:MAG TPA: AgmX/PglI C-terminal domain-containing protein, partial [Kofleriaceae bacterium]|nr:AgmX/PglI C-terminal domain-containing protein [Kofleriaceae bacterium]
DGDVVDRRLLRGGGCHEREQAIEVVAMLGDSVVAVKHCAQQARAGLGSRAYLAIGAVAAVVAVAAFAVSLNVAAQNHAQRLTWVQELARPLSAFRERLLGPGYDLVAFGALGLALGALVLGLWHRHRERAHPLFRIGTAPGVELPVSASPVPSFALVASRQGRLIVRTTRELGGELVSGRATTPLTELIAQGRARQSADGAFELHLPRRGQVRLRCGAVTLLLSAVARPAAQLAALTARGDARPVGYLVASAAAHVALWAILRATPVEASVASYNLDNYETLASRLSATAQEDKPQVGATAEGSGQAGEAAALAEAEGKRGEPERTSAGRQALARTAERPSLTRAQALELAISSGVLGTGALRERSWSGLPGEAELASGLDAATASGDFSGTGPLGSEGSFGAGAQGLSHGGGGFSDLLGTGGRYVTIGDDGTGEGPYRVGGCVSGRPCGLLRNRRGSFVPTVVIGPAPSCGSSGCGLDKAIIRRYIKRAIVKLQYCYEKELLANPELAGTVEATFVIGASGQVISSSATGLHKDVDQCVAGVISSISFPAPQGLAEVRYPFVFRRAS